MSFQDKTIIITGGGKGIGAGCAEVFHREEGQVVLLDVDVEAGTKLGSKLGDRALFIECDISKEQQVIDTMEEANAHFGSIDVLVNNAGILHYATVTETTEKQWNSLMNVNLKGAFSAQSMRSPTCRKMAAA
ncbi:MAG: SDR family oxidoreductase [Balneolaceae bacterium]|nr:SDR family oxidoreductase [Balneolaceae bacterium]